MNKGVGVAGVETLSALPSGCQKFIIGVGRLGPAFLSGSLTNTEMQLFYVGRPFGRHYSSLIQDASKHTTQDCHCMPVRIVPECRILRFFPPCYVAPHQKPSRV
jgi:hypothetical protein